MVQSKLPKTVLHSCTKCVEKNKFKEFAGNGILRGSTTVHTSHLRSKPYFRYSIPGMEFQYRNLDPGTELLHGVWLRCSSDPCFGPFVRSETGT